MKLPIWLFAAALSLSTTAVAAQEHKIRISQHHSSQSGVFNDVIIPVKEFIERESDGRIGVETYPNGVLHGPYDGFKALVTDVTDIAPAFPLQNASSFHLSHGWFLPGGFETSYAINQANEELYPEFTKAEYQALGIEVFLHGASAPYQLLTTKEVKSLSDIKGMKISGAGGPVNEMIAAIGGVPVTLPAAETYSAVQQGVVDGVMLPDESIVTYRMHELAKYYVPVEFGRAGDIPFGLNRATYNNLPEDLKDVIYRAGRYGSLLYADFAQRGAEVGKKALEEHGVTFVELSEQDSATLDAAKAKLWKDFAEKNDANGYRGTEFVEAMRALSEEFGAMTHDQMAARQKEVGKLDILP